MCSLFTVSSHLVYGKGKRRGSKSRQKMQTKKLEDREHENILSRIIARKKKWKVSTFRDEGKTKILYKALKN